MSGPDHYDDPETSVDPEHQALLGLHATANTFDGVRPDPGFGPEKTGAALATLSAAPTDLVSFGARLDVLHALAKEDFPGYDTHQAEYLALATSIGQPHGLDGETVLNDVKASARGDQGFAETDTGRALPHEAVAFVGQKVCNTAKVWVDGKRATWIYSEFETDAPFETLAGWVDPRNWPKRSPMLFKRMDLVGRAVTQIPGPEGAASPPGIEQHWQGQFLEEVQLVDRLETLLHCVYIERPKNTVGMTYDLTRSVGNQIVVDRGFLLASNIGGDVYRAKALKIVGFEQSSWDTVALFVCPLWTEFVRQAAKDGTTTTPRDPSKVPSSPGDDGRPPGSSPYPGAALLKDWVDCVGDAAKVYTDLFAGMGNRAVSGGYRAPDLARDTAQVWLQLAQDWSTAWSKGMDLIEDVAQGNQDFGLRPPPDTRAETAGPAAENAPAAVKTPMATSAPSTAPPTATAAPAAPAAAREESVMIPIPSLAPSATVTCSDLVCIQAGSVTVPDAEVTVTRTTIGTNTPAVKVSVVPANRPAGLYLGALSTSDGQHVPVELYISHAVHGSQ